MNDDEPAVLDPAVVARLVAAEQRVDVATMACLEAAVGGDGAVDASMVHTAARTAAARILHRRTRAGGVDEALVEDLGAIGALLWISDPDVGNA